MGQNLIIFGKNTGQLIGSTLVKKGRQVVLFEKLDGFGIPQHLILNPRIKNIRIHYKDEIYKATTGRFMDKGIPYHKEGYEPQFILPRNQFTKVNHKQTELI